MPPKWVPCGGLIFVSFFLPLLVKHLFRLGYSAMLLKVLKNRHCVTMLFQTKLEVELSPVFIFWEAVCYNLLALFPFLFAVTFTCCPVVVCGIDHVKEHRTRVRGSVYALCSGCFILMYVWAIYSLLWLTITNVNSVLHTDTPVVAALRTELKTSRHLACASFWWTFGSSTSSFTTFSSLLEYKQQEKKMDVDKAAVLNVLIFSIFVFHSVHLILGE